MTNPSERQRAAPYDSDFILAALPDDVDPFSCDHEEGFCQCAHDWRIHWGNVEKRRKRRNVFVTDSP